MIRLSNRTFPAQHQGAVIDPFLLPFRADIEEVQNDVSELETRLEKVSIGARGAASSWNAARLRARSST